MYKIEDNITKLNNTINSWQAGGGTCICCGINAGIREFIRNSIPPRPRTMIVMSDGEANVKCSGKNGEPKTDAINAACNASQNYNITVHAIAFGADSDQNTMQQIAQCGKGDYFYADVTAITDIYDSIANDILLGKYFQQTINASGVALTRLYDDSYIEFEYLEQDIPPGIIITNEKKFSNSTNANFNIPFNSTLIESKVTSYSGAKWTNTLLNNKILIYNLTEYGRDLTRIGDPYFINIPVQKTANDNNISLDTAISYKNFSVGSSSNKVIYTIIREMIAYSQISPKQEGCHPSNSHQQR
jgi:hypothetical protein